MEENLLQNWRLDAREVNGGDLVAELDARKTNGGELVAELYGVYAGETYAKDQVAPMEAVNINELEVGRENDRDRELAALLLDPGDLQCN